MKKSKYVTTVERENGDFLVHSGLTGAVLSIDKEKIPEFKRLLDADPNQRSNRLLGFCNERVLRAFQEAMILINDEIDEVRLLESRYQEAQYTNNGIAQFTIATTMKCNLACPYCYNPNSTRNTTMSQELIKDVSLYVDSIIMPTIEGEERKVLNITWIGGEILTNFKGFSKMTELLYKVTQNNKCEMHSKLVTNGTLLTKEMLEKITRPPFNVEDIQITLDGPKGMHDKTRCYHDGRPTFDVICHNIKLARQYLHTAVRINVGQNSDIDSFRTLIDEMQIRGMNNNENDKLKLGLARINRTLDKDDHVMPMKEFAEFELECARYAKKAGFNMTVNWCFAPRVFFCASVQKNTVVIDAEGFTSRCWSSIGAPKEAFGHVTQNTDLNEIEYRRWMDDNPFLNTKCQNCPVLPLCAGGCPWLRRNFGIESGECCIPERFNLKKRLLFSHFGE